MCIPGGETKTVAACAYEMTSADSLFSAMNSETHVPITVAEAQQKLGEIQKFLSRACGRTCGDIVSRFTKKMMEVMVHCRGYSRDVASESVPLSDVPLTKLSEAMLTASLEIEGTIAGRTLAFRRENPIRPIPGSAPEPSSN